MTVAYLVNQYPHVSHTFIRREIAALERRGVTVVRFSVRRPPADLVDPADRAEVRRTTVILSQKFGIMACLLLLLLTRPARWFLALRAAVGLGRRSDRGVARHLAYFAEACWLARRLDSLGVTHLHAHFGTNPAALAMITRLLGGPPYSFTVHGPDEFDRPESLSLGKKVEHAAFVAAISSFTRSQLMRWSRDGDWDKIQVVRCGLDRDFLDAKPSHVPDDPHFVCVGRLGPQKVGSSRVDLQACKLEYSIVSPK